MKETTMNMMHDAGIERIFETIMMYPADQGIRSIALMEDLKLVLDNSKEWKENGYKWCKRLSNAVASPEKHVHYLDKDFEGNPYGKPGYDRMGSIEITEEGFLVVTLTTGGVMSNPVGVKESRVSLEDLVHKGDSLMASLAIGHLSPGKLRAKLKAWHETVFENVYMDEKTRKPVFADVEMKSKKFKDITVAIARPLPQKEPFLTAAEYKMSLENTLHDVKIVTNISALFSVKKSKPATGVRSSQNMLDIFVQHIFKLA